MSKQAETKSDGEINPQNYNFNQFVTLKILMLSKRYEPLAKSTVELDYMCPRGLSGPPSVTPTKKFRYKMTTCTTKMYTPFLIGFN